MKHKLCMWLLFSMSFLMAFATMENMVHRCFVLRQVLRLWKVLDKKLHIGHLILLISFYF